VATNGSYTYRVVATFKSWTEQSNNATTTVTSPAPTVVSVTRTSATPTNAASVGWTVTFSEAVTGVNAPDFSINKTGVGGTPAVTGVSGSGAAYTVTASTGSGNGTLRLDVLDDDTILDGFGTPLNDGFTGGEVYTFDRTAPAYVSSELYDNDTDGKVDQVKVTFDEALANSTATGQWTLANVPSAGTLASVSTTGSVATLNITEGAGAANTAVGTFTVALTAAAGGIRDSVGNQSSFTTKSPTDKAKPVLINVVSTNGDGLANATDTITFNYSEPLLASTVPTAPSLVLNRTSATATDLTIAGILGQTALGAAYLAGNITMTYTTTTSLPGSAVRTTLTSGGTCTGNFLACLLTGTEQAPGTSPNVSFVAPTTITDAAGNAATGTVTQAIRLF
jgi:hypothetical protein